MITKVEARNAKGDVMTMYPQAASSGVILAEIIGLDPVKASLVSTPFAIIDGAKFRSSRRETRNLIFKFDLETDYRDYSIQDVRRRLYQFFMPKSPVSFRFFDDDGPTTAIAGRVESCEAALFTKEPAMDLSVICFAPDFYDLTPTVISWTTVNSSLDRYLDYKGSSPTGIEISVKPNRAMSSFSIYNRPPDGTLRQLDFAAPLQAGDTLYINTIQGSKLVQLTRAGVNTSLLYAISPKSDWISFEPGPNNYRVYAEGAAVPYTITYVNRYGGL